MRVSATTNYIDEVYRVRVDNLLKAVKEEFPKEYPIFLKIRAYYTKNQASNITVYSRLTRLRTACKIARQLFGKPLTKLTRKSGRCSQHIYMVSTTPGMQ